MEKKAIKVHPEDNVAVALIDVWEGKRGFFVVRLSS